MEAVPLIQKATRLLTKAVKKTSSILRAYTKIQLAVNVCGPVLLFPQTSSSPNVIIVHIGGLQLGTPEGITLLKYPLQEISTLRIFLRNTPIMELKIYC